MDKIEGIRKLLVAVVAIIAVAAMAILNVSPQAQDWAKEIILWVVGLFTAGNVTERLMTRKSGETPPTTTP